MSTPGSAPIHGFAAACAAIARAIAGSLPFEQVLERIDDAARLIVTFDSIGVWREEVPDGPLTLTFRRNREFTPTARELRRADHSPALWPKPEAFPHLIGDAPRELDPGYAMDRVVIDRGYRAVLLLSLDASARQIFWLLSREPDAFTPEHARALSPILDLVILAVQHDHLRSLTEDRRRRREALETLLPTLARALDVRSVWPEMSEVVKQVLPHDTMTLGLLNEDKRGFRLHASTAPNRTGGPTYEVRSEREAAVWEWDFFIAHEYAVQPDDTVRVTLWDPVQRRKVTRIVRLPPFWLEAYTVVGVRSELRVPIWIQGERAGFLFFGGREANMFGEDDVELARRVADHLAVAIAHERLAAEAQRAAQAQAQAAQLQERVDALVVELEGVSPHRALGRSLRWRDVLESATKVSQTDTTVLITGESGTGKEVVARYLHRASKRSGRPFVAINCAALPEQLLESELFGYERGAFTGAQSSRPGRIEQASGGTLFLDELGEMAPPVQAKFLRVLQEREFQRLGGSATIKADIRVIAATNRDPRVAMERGTLREDLYYRLSVFEITLPALRERPEDILVLAEAFLEEIGRSVGRPAAGLSKDARDRLLGHRWPGNVRELRNAIERAVILCDGGLVTGDHLPIAVAAAPRPSPAAAPVVAPVAAPAAASINLEDVERELIREAMEQANHNKSEAARLLGLARGQLYSRLKRYGLTKAKR